MKTVSGDIIIIGSGITAANMAAHLADNTTRSITVIEAGRHSTPFRERGIERHLATCTVVTSRPASSNSNTRTMPMLPSGCSERTLTAAVVFSRFSFSQAPVCPR